MAGLLPLRPLIITHVNFAFGHSFVLNLLDNETTKFDGENSSPTNLLISPLASVNLPESFEPFLSQESPRLNVFFGSTGNKELIRKIIDEKKINAIFLFLEEESEEKEEAHQIVARTRQFLISQLCPLLEAIRQCPSQSNRPTLVPIFFEPPNANFLQSNWDVQQKGPIPTVQCLSEASARFSSAHALLHSFAVSYRLNIQIAILPIQPTNDAIKFVMELAQIQGGNARIHRFSTEKAIIDEGNEAAEMKPNSSRILLVRVLIFGHLASVDRAKLGEQIGEISIEKLMEAETKPGLDVDEAIEAELLAKGPTHVGWVAETDEKTLADWKAGGPAQLRENVRQNLFTPWLLRQICGKFGIHFFTLNQSKNAEGPIEANSRYAVVSHFADKLAKLELEFGNQN